MARTPEAVEAHQILHESMKRTVTENEELVLRLDTLRKLEARQSVAIERLEGELASACDLLNTWCRTEQVPECKDPYKNLGLRNAIDALWAKLSSTKPKRAAHCCKGCGCPVDQSCDWCGECACEEDGL